MDNNRINLISCGLISKNDDLLWEFINFNKVNTVDEFILMMDNNSFDKGKVYTDLLLQARGVSDLLKLKYYDNSLLVDSYLCSVIRDYTFKIYGSGFTYLSVTDSFNKKVIINSAISRIGFNDKEKDIILSVKNIEGRKLIDVLLDVYNDTIDSDKINKDENVIFRNKLMLIITYYKNKISNPEVISDNIQGKMEELSELMKIRMDLDKLIDKTSKEILDLEKLHEGARKL